MLTRANLITIFRIIGSICLFFLVPFSILFYIIYTLCGLSDMIDGYVARKTDSTTRFGNNLDSIADFIFFAVCCYSLLRQVYMPIWLWVWIGVIAIIKIFNLIYELIIRKKIYFLHTLLNKISGFIAFLIPYTLPFLAVAYPLTILCFIALIASIQETYFIKTGQYIED